MNNMHIPPVSYDLVFHATDLSGVTDVELSINNQVAAQVPLINPPQGVKVYFFYRLRNMTTNALTNWNDGLNMTDKGAGMYQVTLSSKSIPDVQTVLHGASAEFQYQFDATGLGTDPLRSPVYSDIQFTTCN